MEMEASSAAPVVVANKVRNIVRAVLFMLRKRIAKSKLMVELHLLVKRGKIAAGKAFAGTLMLHHHYAAFTCRSENSHLSFVSPREYEFSCSNSPAFPFHAITNKRKQHKSSYKHYDDVYTMNAVQKVLIEMMNREKVEVANSPPLMTLPGFGKSPVGRQLRITDSPFPLKDDDGDGDAQVDKAAEEFINKFYKDLNLQRRMAAFDSPYNNFWDR